MSFQAPPTFYPVNRELSSCVPSNLDLLLLPDVAKLQICKFLDTGSLLNLRLTCRVLKTTVEQPSVMVKIPVKISYSKQLQKVLESNVPFNNFILSFQNLNEQSYFSDFTNFYGSGIRKLHIGQQSHGGFGKILMLLEKCLQLQELEIETFDVRLWTANCDKVLKNFSRNLKKLWIHKFVGSKLSVKEEVQAFVNMLESCGKLTEFKIPKMNAYSSKLEYRYCLRSLSSPDDPFHRIRNEAAAELNNRRNNINPVLDDEDSWEPVEVEESTDPYPEWANDNNNDILLHPIVNLIQTKRLSKLRQIDLGSIPFFEQNSLKDLFSVCYRNSIFILNLDSTQLARLSCDIFSLYPEFLSCFESAHVSHIHKLFPISRMNNLKNISFTIVPRSSHPGLLQDDVLKMPALESLRVQFLYDVEESKNKLLIKKIFKDLKRPNVKKLQLEWRLENPNSETIKINDLAINFFNVRDLYIYSWCSLTDNDCVLLWTNLTNLVKLELKDCKNLTNKAFIGPSDGNSPFSRLKNLKDLYIRDVSGKINHSAIYNCFIFLPLRSLTFKSTVIDTMNIKVYKKVAMSPLGKSVEHFNIPKPKCCSHQVKKEIMKTGFGFANLRRPLFSDTG